MASRLASFRPMVQEFALALKAFHSSGSRFQVLKTIQHPTFEPSESLSSIEPSDTGTLFILDSSFNPPSIAHQSLATSALEKSACARYSRPLRLLLLFATKNADKAPTAAQYDQRLTMMSMFAHDLLETLVMNRASHEVVPVDIGVTTAPYYTDKSEAIEIDGARWYPTKPTHIHLIGYDTLTRLFAAKYYPNFDPPLSALESYFGNGHQIRATLRPDDSSTDTGDQQKFLTSLGDGEMEPQGAKREWAPQITLVPANRTTGISSTKIRSAAKRGDWEEVSQLSTPTVADWVEVMRIYD